MSRRNLLTNAVAQLLLVLGIVLGINISTGQTKASPQLGGRISISR